MLVVVRKDTNAPAVRWCTCEWVQALFMFQIDDSLSVIMVWVFFLVNSFILLLYAWALSDGRNIVADSVEEISLRNFSTSLHKVTRELCIIILPFFRLQTKWPKPHPTTHRSQQRCSMSLLNEWPLGKIVVSLWSHYLIVPNIFACTCMCRCMSI